MSNITDDKSLNKLIRAALNSGAAFAAALHKAGNACLVRVEENGDVRFLNNLAAGLTPKALEALAVWAVKFGKVTFDRDTKGFKFRKNASITADMIADREAIGPMELVRTQKPRETHEFNLAAEITKLIERATKKEIGGKPIELLRNAAKAATGPVSTPA